MTTSVWSTKVEKTKQNLFPPLKTSFNQNLFPPWKRSFQQNLFPPLKTSFQQNPSSTSTSLLSPLPLQLLSPSPAPVLTSLAWCSITLLTSIHHNSPEPPPCLVRSLAAERLSSPPLQQGITSTSSASRAGSLACASRIRSIPRG